MAYSERASGFLLFFVIFVLQVSREVVKSSFKSGANYAGLTDLAPPRAFSMDEARFFFFSSVLNFFNETRSAAETVQRIAKPLLSQSPIRVTSSMVGAPAQPFSPGSLGRAMGRVPSVPDFVGAAFMRMMEDTTNADEENGHVEPDEV